MPGLRYFNELAANRSQKCPACPGGRPVRAQPGGAGQGNRSVPPPCPAFFLGPPRPKRGGGEGTAAPPMPSPLPTEGECRMHRTPSNAPCSCELVKRRQDAILAPNDDS